MSQKTLRNSKLKGIWTALVTPFNAAGEIDWEAYQKLLKFQKDAGVHGVVPCGTTGESPTLTRAEKERLITTAIEELKGSETGVIAGTGSNNTAETIEFSKWASDQGVDGVLIVSPYYNKPSQAGLENHFRSVADAVSCDVVLYNVPGRTAVSLTTQTIARLASHPRISTIKEATASIPFTSELIQELTDQRLEMNILSGDDPTLLALLSVGAQGTISVASNLIPAPMVEMFDAVWSNDLNRAREIHQKYTTLFRDLFVESNPVPIKHAMAKAGFGTDSVRAPLAQLSPTSVEKLEATLKEIL